MKSALICEDDDAIRQLVGTVIRREGFSVDFAEDGAVGMEKISEGCYDLLVLDLMMPGVDGYAVVEFLKNRHPERLKRVVITSALSEAVRHSFPVPVCQVVPKPFDIDALRDAVRTCAVACEGEARGASA